jgi:hypothetical protein
VSTRTQATTAQELWQQEMDEHGSQLPLLLHPGENIRGIVQMRFGWLVKDPPERYVAPARGLLRILAFIDWLDLPSSIHPIKALLRRIPGNKPLSGGWKRAAGQFVIAAARVSGSAPKVNLVVTDRRVIALGTRYDTPLAQQKVAGEYRRDQLTLRAGSPRRPGKGVDIAFPDGTWVRMGGKQLPDELLVRLLSE